MGFAAPGLAWLAALAAIPVLVHILSRLRLRRVRFPSLMLLTAVRRERVSWVRIREIILLILRTLALLALLLVLARPFIRRPVAGLGRLDDLVLLLDDSWSLDYPGRWTAAKGRAQTLIRSLAPGRRVSLLLASGRAAAPGLVSPDQALALLDTAAPSTLAPTLGPGIERARSLANAIGASVLVVTDLQARAFADSAARGPATVVPVGDAAFNNCGVELLETGDRFPAAGRPLRVRAVVANHSARVQTRSAVFHFNGTRQERLITLPARGRQALEFDLGPASPGVRGCSLALGSDSLPLDDRCYLVVNIPAATRVLLVGSARANARYVLDALAADSGSGFELSLADPAALASARLNRYDVVALLDPYALATADWNRFEFYLRSGGAGLVFAGPLAAGPDRLEGVVTTEGFARPAGFFSVSEVDTTSDLLAGLGPAAFADIHVSEYARLESGDGRVLARLSDGSPLLLEHPEFRLVSSAVSPVPSNSDLVFRAVFVPLLHRTLSFLGRRALDSRARVGDTLRFRLDSPAPVNVLTPSGAELLEPEVENALPWAVYARTGRPGVYRFDTGADPDRAFAVNVIADEGDLVPIDLAELERLGFDLADPGRGRADLAGPLLLLAAAALLAEMLLLLF